MTAICRMVGSPCLYGFAVALWLASIMPTHGYEKSVDAETPKFLIVIKRLTESSGRLSFIVTKDGMTKTVFTTRCWWDPTNRIPAGTYTGCSTTRMATKNYPAVYLPDKQTGKKGIFIHQGSSPRDSRGCIVIAKEKIRVIYETVPRNGKQVVVRVVDY